MRKGIFLVIFIGVIVILSSYSFAECDYSAEISLELESLFNKEISPYQFPDFREGDLLAIKSLKITNTGDCTLVNPEFILNLTNEKGQINAPFCSNDHVYRIQGNITVNDSLQDSPSRCRVVLNTIGGWEISAKPYEESKNPTHPKSISFKVNQIFLNEPVGFRVYSNLEMQLRDSAKNSNNIALIAVLTTLIVFGGSIYFSILRHHKNQIGLLRSLWDELQLLEIKVNKSKEFTEENKNRLPFLKIKLDSNFYSKNLDWKIAVIKDWKVYWIKTRELKINLNVIDERIMLIDYHCDHIEKLILSQFGKLEVKRDITKNSNASKLEIKSILSDIDIQIKEVKRILKEEFGIKSEIPV